jgi:hypothetical protein
VLSVRFYRVRKQTPLASLTVLQVLARAAFELRFFGGKLDMKQKEAFSPILH